MRGRIVAGALLAAALVAGVGLAVEETGPSGTSAPPSPSRSSHAPSAPPTTSSPSPAPSDTSVSSSPQPTEGFPPITRLTPGQRPPQFVVVSFDGACKHELWQHYLDLATATGSHFTFFLSGLCLVPDSHRLLYHPPGKPVGYSAIGFGQTSLIPQRIRDITSAYDEGDEIGTHFLGHFCDARGVGTWTSADWSSEIAQARTFLDSWRSINGITDPSLQLPFDSSIWKGDRTPCLLGNPRAMYPVFVKQGFRYDASSAGSLAWPRTAPGYPSLWLFPLQRIKVVGYGRTNLSMDYNLLYVQNKGQITAPPATCTRIEQSTYQSLMQALGAVDKGSRAPFFIGNHFNEWASGAYVKALTRFVHDARTTYPDVQFVTFAYLTRWLDAQDPKVLTSLQARPAPRY